MTEQAGGIAADQVGDESQLVESMQDQIDYLRDLLKTRDQELAEMRRLLAGALERIPELEPAASPEPQESPTEASGSTSPPHEQQGQTSRPQEERSWWRRFFFGP